MFKSVLAVVCVTILSPTLGLADDTIWTRRYNGPASSDEAARAVLTDSANNVIVVGSSPGTVTGNDFVIIKYSPAGDMLWTKRIAESGRSNDDARAAAIDRSGAVYVTGTAGTFPEYWYLTVKVDPDGNEVWRATYQGSGGKAAYPVAIAVDQAGNACVTGYVADASGVTADYVTVKYNPDGDTVWTAVYDGGGKDYAAALALGPNSDVYVTGAGMQGSFDDYATVKYNAAGARQWVALYNGPGNAADQALALAVDPSGNVYVTGRSGTAPPPAGVNHYATVKHSPSGQTLWTRRYTGVGRHNEPKALALSASAVYVTGKSGSVRGDNDYATVAYALSTGDTLWVRRFDGPPGKDDAAAAIAVGPDRRVLVTGTSLDWNNRGDYMSIIYSESGTQIWAARYNSPYDNDEQAVALAVDVRCDFLVLGASFGAGNYDLQAVKYDSSAVGGVFEQVSHASGRSWLRVSPSPAHTQTTVSLRPTTNNGSATLALYDASGALCRRYRIENRGSKTTLDLTGLAPGVYLARLETAGKTESAKLVIR